MIDEKLDIVSHDMAFTGYDEQIVSDKDQVLQNIKIRLLLVMGELFDNTLAGVDYFGQIFKKNADPAVIDALIQSTIKNTPEVVDLISYSSNLDRSQRSMSITFKVDTIYGQSEITNTELIQ